MRAIRCIVIAVAAFGLLTGVAGADGKRAFKADPDSYQEVPALSTTGTGSFALRLNAGEDEASYELSYQGLEGGGVLFAHIHLGERHTNGGVIVFLCSNVAVPVATPSCPPDDGTVVSGTLMAGDVIGPAGQGIAAGEFAEFVEALRVGATYVNVHTAGFAAGEIRGQVQ